MTAATSASERPSYAVTVRYLHPLSEFVVIVSPFPGESLAQALLDSGEVQHEWVIADVRDAAARDARIAELTAAWEESTGDTAADYSLSEDDWAFGLDTEEAAEIARLIDWKKENA